MYILNDLWNGNVTPDVRYVRSDSEYHKISHQLSEKSDLFIKDLSPEQSELYDELENLQYKLFNISEEDTFITGFRLGARMILDVIGDHKGQFKPPSEV